MRTLYQSPQYVVLEEIAHQVVLIQRTAAPFENIEEVRETHRQMEEAVAQLDRAKYRLVWDLREGPLRNDPLFESATAGYRRSIMKGFVRKFVLVATGLGKLQVQRHSAVDKLDVEVFDTATALRAALGAGLKLKL